MNGNGQAGQAGAGDAGTQGGVDTAAGAGGATGAGGAQGAGDAAGQTKDNGQQGNTGQSGNTEGGGTVIGAGGSQDNAGQGAGQGGESHWSEAAPESMRKALEGFAKPEDAMQALERGKGYVPLTDPAAVQVAFPEGMPVDAAMLGSYKEFAAKAGLTQEQAQLAADYYLQQQAAQRKAEFDNAVTSLQGAWGDKFDANAGKVNGLVAQLDSKLGGRLQPAFAAGLGNNPVLAEALLIVADAMGETQFGGNGGPGSPGGGPPMSREEFLRTQVFKTSS